MSTHFCTKNSKKFVDFLSFSGLRGKFFQFFLCQFPKFADEVYKMAIITAGMA